MDIDDFINDRLQHYGEAIRDTDGDAEDHALGEITFYAALRRLRKGRATKQDLGLLDAVNDTLQELGILNKGQSFYKI
jgi:hypothetical protein